MGLKYTTSKDFNEQLEMIESVPDYPTTTSREATSPATGDNSNTVFYLSKKGVIELTESLYTGSIAESAATTLLTRGTHYNMDYDKSKITLTATGVSSVAENGIFTEYNYNKYNKINSIVVKALEQAESMIDDRTHTVFTSAASSTPQFTVVTDEYHTGQGDYNRVYQTDSYPLNSSTTVLSGAIGTSTTTISVASTDGFPTTGTIAAGSNKISYTGKTSTTFTGVTGITSSVADASTVTSYVIERSLEPEGTTPSWTVMIPDVDYNIDTLSGEFNLVNSNVASEIRIDNFNPSPTVWNRVRVSYQYGWESIPEDIVYCVHLIAGKIGFSSQVLNALSRGTDGFDSGGIDDINDQIDKIINKYKSWMIKSTKEQ